MQTTLHTNPGTETRARRLPPMAMKDKRGRHNAVTVGRHCQTANEPKHHWFILGHSSRSPSHFYLPSSLALSPMCVCLHLFGSHFHAHVSYFDKLNKINYCKCFIIRVCDLLRIKGLLSKLHPKQSWQRGSCGSLQFLFRSGSSNNFAFDFVCG